MIRTRKYSTHTTEVSVPCKVCVVHENDGYADENTDKTLFTMFLTHIIR